MSAEIPFRRLPLELDGVHYEHGPTSFPRPDVAAGRTTELVLAESAVYPGTVHRVTVHVPAGLAPGEPASLALFLDGDGFLDPTTSSAPTPCAGSPTEKRSSRRV